MTDTLAAPATHLLEVRHSRFLAHAEAVDGPVPAMQFVARVSDPDATHNCWAWRIGQDYRSSDDGEPAGTAGRPILAAIDGQGYDRIAVVVTRWYGGIKLGAGGLVRAYGGTAAECLRIAPRQPLVAMADLGLACAFDDLGLVHAALPAHAAEKTGERFETDGAHLSLRLPAAQVDALQRRLRDATRDRVRFHIPQHPETP
ncbi:IMPACT family protein [Pseudoxanthomonas daejeonensis]|uniref:IMPACT family protein n=1 Tax=Pseudoxanthomonas daejeonensis TaxID=266062 RepID=A0ABQ6Z545_9GAMM|nr:YigZ family protein [Pseudoxanthomonas daejeonensis]KAF1693298.1 IMPACT family protein [Pseudoxanthomonas daejeonensis]